MFCASLKVAKVAMRGLIVADTVPVIAATKGNKELPEILTTPMPPRPGAVAIAAMVSRETILAMLFVLLFSVMV